MSSSGGRRPRPHTDDWQWQLEGACRARDPEEFFHPASERGAARAARERRAKQVCASCPVRQPCLDHALRSAEAYGVWGGTTEQERAALQDRDSRRAG